MARVFNPPTYRDQDLHGATLLGSSESADTAAILGTFGMVLSAETLVSIAEHIPDEDSVPDLATIILAESASARDHPESYELSSAYSMGVRRSIERLLRWTDISKMNIGIIGQRRVWSDSDAAMELWRRLTTGEIPISDNVAKAAISVEATARDIATAGLVSSFVSPRPGADSVAAVPLVEALSTRSRVLANCMCLADKLRLGNTSPSTKLALSDVMSGACACVAENFLLAGRGFDKFFVDSTWAVYHVGPYNLIVSAEEVFIVGGAHRAVLADTLWTAGMWVMGGMGARPAVDRGMCHEAALEGVIYIQRAMATRRAAGKRCDTLARQMKTSYAATLAQFGAEHATAAERELADGQTDEILEQAQALSEGEPIWYEVTSAWPDVVAVDFGTAWNLIPAPDADPERLDKSVQAKLNAKRQIDEPAWASFIAYAMSVISGHILCKRQDEEFTWDIEGAEDLEWVRSCRNGVLAYPSIDNPVNARIVGCFDWIDHLSSWVYTAQSVTHVLSDKERYSSIQAHSTVGRMESNELMYAATKGPLLGGKWHPSVVREMWDQGSAPGDRVLVQAAKKENTKDPSKTRETSSADGVCREILTEVDINMATIGAFVEGSTSRASRATMERSITRIIDGASSSTLLCSADVSGWSPNMVREKELAFIDALMCFFRIPSHRRVSAVFKDIYITMNRAGYHSLWTAKDGSIQGFFGGGDTIMHSLIAQWSVRECKKSGLIARSATMSKVAQIDDILQVLRKLQGNPMEVAQHIAVQYAKLGFEIDLVKSLISHLKGHFLNRLYSNRSEVISSAKIFARCDREWERQWLTIYDIAESVFSSMLGAVDRGTDPVHGYTVACFRVTWLYSQMTRGVALSGTSLTAFGAWLHRSLGGWGLPTAATWLTRDSALSLESSMGAICTIARVTATSDTAVSDSLMASLEAAAGVELVPRLASAYATDPFAIRVAGNVDPSTIVRDLGNESVRKLCVIPEIKSLAEAATSDDYHDALDDLLKTCPLPAAIIQEFASTLPGAVGVALMDKFTVAECLFMSVPYKKRAVYRRNLRAANRQALNGWKKICTGAPTSPSTLVSGSEVAYRLRVRQANLGSYATVGLQVSSVLDSIAQVDAAGPTTIELHIPDTRAGNIYDGVPGARNRLIRSAVSRPLVTSGAGTSRGRDPVSRSVESMAAVVAFCSAIGVDSRAMVRLYTDMWLGRDYTVKFPVPVIEGSNPARLSGRLSMKTHTVCALPNLIGTIKVDASKAIRVFEDAAITIPWPSVVYTLKAAAALDLSSGGAGDSGSTRHYQLRRTITTNRPPLGDNVGADASVRRVDTCLAGEAHENVVKIFEQVAASLQSGGDGSEDEGVPAEFGSALLTLPTRSVQLSAMAVLQSRGAGHLGRAIAVGAAHSEQYRSGAPAGQLPRVGTQEAEIGAARGERQARVTHSMQAEALQLLVPLARKFESESLETVVALFVENRAEILRHGHAWGLMQITRDINDCFSGDEKKATKAVRRICSTLCSGGGALSEDKAAYWRGSAEDHRRRAGLGDRRSLFMAHVLSQWEHAAVTGASWERALHMTLVALDTASSELLGVQDRHVITNALASTASTLLLKNKDFQASVIERIAELGDGPAVSNATVVAAAKTIVFRVEEYFVLDWLGPVALRERARAAMNVAVSPSDAPLDLGGLAIAPAVDWGQEEAQARPEDREPVEWAAWADVHRGGLDWIDAEGEDRDDFMEYVEDRFAEVDV